MADFGPRITVKIVESLRDDIYAGKLKSGSEIKVYSLLNASVLITWIICFLNLKCNFKCLQYIHIN